MTANENKVLEKKDVKKLNKNNTKYTSLNDFFDIYYNKNRPINKEALLRLKNKETSSNIDIKQFIDLVENDVYLERTQKLWIKIIEINDEKINDLFKYISRNILLSYNFNGMLSMEINNSNLITLENIGNEIRKILEKYNNVPNEKDKTKKVNNLITILLAFLYIEGHKFDAIYDIYDGIISTGIKCSSNPSIFFDALFSPEINMMHTHEKISINKLNHEKSIIINQNHEHQKLIEENKKNISTLQNIISENQIIIQHLKDEIYELKNTINSSNIDTSNRIENIKGYIVSKLSTNINLLKNGLLALQSPNPKPEITMDHNDRVVDALSKCIKEIREF